MSGRTARTLACAADLFARSLKLRYDGTAIASRMPRMMMTTRSSIRVKPCSEPRRVLRRVIIEVLLLDRGWRMSGVSAGGRALPPTQQGGADPLRSEARPVGEG